MVHDWSKCTEAKGTISCESLMCWTMSLNRIQFGYYCENDDDIDLGHKIKSVIIADESIIYYLIDRGFSEEKKAKAI